MSMVRERVAQGGQFQWRDTAVSADQVTKSPAIAGLFFGIKKPASAGYLLPAQRATNLIVSHASLKEVFLFAQVHHLAHPREWVLYIKFRWQAKLC